MMESNLEARFQPRTSFNYELKNIQSLFCGKYSSEQFYVQNLPWKIEVEIKKIDNLKHINIFLCNNYETNSLDWDWECCAVWTMKLLNCAKSENSKIKNKISKFSESAKKYAFWSVFVPFEWLEKNGFVHNKSLQVSLDTKADEPKNCNFSREEFYYLLQKEREKSEEAIAESIRIKFVSAFKSSNDFFKLIK